MKASVIYAVAIALLLGVSGIHGAATPQAAINKESVTPEKKGVKPEKKKEPPKINGIAIGRRGGGFLGIEIVGGRFKLSFYDAKKKPAAPDVVRAALRWPVNYKIGDERAVLTPDGETALSSSKVVRPPYVFKLFITLIKSADDTAASEEARNETYVVDFRQ